MLIAIIAVVIIVFGIGIWGLMKVSGECSRQEEKQTLCKHHISKKCGSQCCHFCFAVQECTNKCLMDPRSCGKEVNIHTVKEG